MNEKTEICKALRLLEAQRDSLNVQADLGIISVDGAREELNMITRKERELRDRLVTTNHVTEDGTMRAISHHKPTPDNPKEYYSTKMPDGKKIKATTYNGLMDKLFLFYTDGLRGYSIRSVFTAALHEKEITENPNQHTIVHYQTDFNRYISAVMADADEIIWVDIPIMRLLKEKEEAVTGRITVGCKGMN